MSYFEHPDETMTYFRYVGEGYMLSMEMLVWILYMVIKGVVAILGAPFYLVGKVASKHFNRVNEKQINREK